MIARVLSSPQVQIGLLVVGAYLVGAVPFGLLVGWMKGIDVRKAGSGNIGATNVGRLLGGKYFALVFVLDALKGAVPMVAGSWVVKGLDESPVKYLLWLSVGLAALLGHVFPIYLGFKGGKGVATALGVMLGVWPFYTFTAIPAVAVFVGVFSVSRFISLSSIVGAALFPVLLMVMGWALGWDLLGTKWPLLAFAVLVGALVIYRHRSNIARLWAGTELRMGGKKAEEIVGR
jgi:glycerol-3-phosphate acyltransferase PlsY